MLLRALIPLPCLGERRPADNVNSVATYAPQLAEDNKPIDIDEMLDILGDNTDDDTDGEEHEEVGELACRDDVRSPSRSRSRSRSSSRGRIQWRTPQYMKVC